MKKKILSFSSVALGCALAFTALESNSGGQFGSAAGGCSCHGPANSATSVSITGLPAQLTPGANYTMAVTVSNSSQSEVGFNLLASAGDFTPTAVADFNLNPAKTEVTHKAPVAISAGSVTFSNIIFKAPSTPGSSVTFNVAGNACNNDGATSGDGWNKTSLTVPVNLPASVNDINTKAFASCLPNVVTNQTTIKANVITSLQVVSLQGQVMLNQEVGGANTFNLDCSKFAAGTYIVRGASASGFFTTKFSKQ
jgi:hypothetical protein